MAQALHMARLLDATVVLVISKHCVIVRIVNQSLAAVVACWHATTRCLFAQIVTTGLFRLFGKRFFDLTRAADTGKIS